MEQAIIWISGFVTGAMVNRAFILAYEYEWQTKGYLTLGQVIAILVGKVSDGN